MIIVQVTEERVAFIRQYSELLDTVETGFLFIRDQLSKERFGQVNRMFVDIFDALEQIDHSSQLLKEIFNDHVSLLSTLEEFDQFVVLLKPLENLEIDFKEKSTYLSKKIIPFFNNWKQSVQYYLVNHISN